MRISGMRAFVLLGIGQVFSIFGTSLSSFALGVWVFEQTQSVMQFALVTIFITVPGIVIKPVAGALVDRWDRRAVLIGSDALAALLTVLTFVLVQNGQLTVWYIYVMTLVQTIATAFQLPASSAAMQLLVPATQFGRASGAIGAIKSVSAIIAPLIAGGLLATIGLAGILLIDFCTFLIAVGTLLLIFIPPIQPQATQRELSLWHEIKDGWTYIMARQGFILLASFSMLVTGVFELARVLLTPLVLSFTTASVLGIITSAAGFGALLGNVVMLLWNGPRRRSYGIIGFGFAIGLSLVLGGLYQSVWLIGSAVVIVMAGIPIVWACIEAIWLSKVPPYLIGRVRGTTHMLDSLMATITLLSAGLLADRVFAPLLVEGGALARSIGAIIGVGPGRGIALMLILTGLLTLLIVALGVLSPAVRRLEDTLPDVDIAAYINTHQEQAPNNAPLVEKP